MHAPTRKHSILADMNQMPDLCYHSVGLFCNCASAQGLVYELACFCKTNSHTSSRLRLTLWCCWPYLTPFVSLPASDVTICLFLYYQSWPAPLQLCHLHSLTTQWALEANHTHTHTHTHTQTHIYTQHDTYAGRLSCLDMLVVISVTSHIARSAASIPPNEAYKMKYSSRLYGSSSAPPLLSHYTAPIILSRRGSAPKQTVNLSCFVISSVATERHTNTCPLYRFNVSRCVAVMHGSAVPRFGFKKKNWPDVALKCVSHTDKIYNGQHRGLMVSETAFRHRF